VKFIEKFKTRGKNLEIEKIIALDKNLEELFFVFYSHSNESLFLTLKIIKLLTLFSTKCLKITKRWTVVELV